MIRRKLGTFIAFINVIFLVGCGNVKSNQTIKELEVGQNVELSSLISVEEGVECTLISTNIDFNKVGTYTAEFQLTKGKKTQLISYDFSVVDTVAPQITFPDTLYIFENENIDLSDFISCVDNLDGNVKDFLVISDFDTSVQGIQNIELSVSDSSGNVANEKMVLCVIERNDPVEFAGYLYPCIKDNLTYSDSFIPQSVKYKIVDDGYIYCVNYKNKNIYDEIVDNSAYIKVMKDGSVIPWEERNFESLQLNYWSSKYNENTLEEISLLLDDIQKMIEDKKAISKSKWITGIDDEEKIYTNANIVLAELNANTKEFNLTEIYSKKIDGIYYYRVIFTNRGSFGIVSNEEYFKVDQSGNIIYYDSGDGYFLPFWESTSYWLIEYWENSKEELYLNPDNVKY